TNFKDSARAWFAGGGVRLPIGSRSVALRAITLDFGLRYHSGATASYLREGSIQDGPGGTITITPLVSRTPYLAYVAGIRVRIPRGNPAVSCPRFLCLSAGTFDLAALNQILFAKELLCSLA